MCFSLIFIAPKSPFSHKGVSIMKRMSLKLVSTVLLLTVMASLLFTGFALDRAGAYVVETEQPHDRLNVHSTPSIDNVVDHLDDGTVVQYQYSDDGWWYVQWRKADNSFAYGYVDGKFLTAVDKAAGMKFTCVDNLYVHSQSSIVPGECASYHIDQLKAGKKFNVVKQDGTWSYVEYDGNYGWVSSVYMVEAK